MNTLLQPLPFLTAAIVMGAIIGSFITMLVHRLPRIMERQWREECRAFLQLDQGAEGSVSDGLPPEPMQKPNKRGFSLAYPPSHCPHCSHPLRLIDNIPLFGFLLNRGRCHHCGHTIGWRYLTIELLSIVVAVMAAVVFGPGLQAVAAMGFGWTLLALLFIDLEHQLLPDPLTMTLLWSGLLLNQQHLFASPSAALWGAVSGYLALWGVLHLYRLVTGRSGMGGGDLKLLAALGAWCGWTLLPQILLFASLSGLLIATPLLLLQRSSGESADTNLYRTPIPFGPFLALAGWITLLWGASLESLPVTIGLWLLGGSGG